MAYIGSSPTKVVSRQSANIFTYTATANQTAFTGADANGNTLACTPSDIMVHMNGLRLEESDYTASTTTVTLGSGAAAGDEVTITAFVTFETADAYTKSASDTRYVNTAGDSMTGGLTVDAENGNQLLLDNDGERFTQISLKNNGSQYAAVWYDSSDNVLVNHAASGKGFVVQTGGSTDRLVIDSSGRVTTPYQPAFMVIMTSAPTLTGTSTTTLPWNSEIFDTGSNFNTSNYRFTAPVSGKYHMHLHLELHSDSNWTSSTWSYIGDFWVNGVQKTGADFWGHSGKYNLASNVAILDINANDYVDVRARPNNNTLRYSGDAAGSFGNCRWFGYLIG